MQVSSPRIFIESMLAAANKNARKYCLTLILILSFIEVTFIVTGKWAGDFWEHCAVLKELMRNINDPIHPIIYAKIPHAFYSPYMIALAYFGRLANMAPIHVLSLAALFNLLLWISGLFLFIKTFYTEKAWSIFLFLLILHLFCWGPNPWIYSSFFHFNTLHYVLPYPSTFAVGLVFISGFALSKLFEIKKIYLLPILSGLTIINSIVLLTHPTSFLLLIGIYTVIGYEWLKDQHNKIILAYTILPIFIPLVLAFAWPYYPFWDLVFSHSVNYRFHQDSRQLYNSVFLKIIPALPALLFFKKGDVANRRVYELLFLLTIIYLLGYVTKSYGYGRTISFIVLLLQFLLASYFSSLRNLNSKELIVLLMIPILSIPFLYDSLKTVRANIPIINRKSYSSFEFIEKYVAYDNIVLTDKHSIRLVPSFGGRVTATAYPPYWITDIKTRLEDIEIFYSNEATVADRKLILDKYNVDYILLDKSFSKLNQEVVNVKKDLNIHYVDESDRFVLFKTINH